MTPEPDDWKSSGDGAFYRTRVDDGSVAVQIISGGGGVGRAPTGGAGGSTGLSEHVRAVPDPACREVGRGWVETVTAHPDYREEWRV